MRMFGALLLSLAVACAVAAPARALTQQQELIEKSTMSIQKIVAREDIRPHLFHYMKSAKGILILPEVLKAGFFLGGQGGSGVLLAKSDDGRWSYPAFYTMGGASIGLQFGGQSMETVLLLMTSKAVTAVLENKVKIGGELSAAVGPQGIGVGGATSAALGADILTYSIARGAFIGAALEGAIIEQRDTMNREFYGSQEATPRAIVLDGRFANPAADRLRQTLAGLPE